jgi:hypothetical protein
MEIGGVTSINTLLAITSVKGPRRNRWRAEDLASQVEQPRLASLRKVDENGLEAPSKIESSEHVNAAVGAVAYGPSPVAAYGVGESPPPGGRLVDLLA